ncbi:alpha/beta-hydrolase [Plenodomus tracheiphilus IPT5]|uniref:Alpha/beta-hydrolase n=1 Tax=Plenodomus tracheiphilus IPT5 TaxID=1408161 RepID=A0A6A7BEJ7_9PLEO|nr:alpha/beta-hydrolase [Plenodomus tracheiphilus IPT5]
MAATTNTANSPGTNLAQMDPIFAAKMRSNNPHKIPIPFAGTNASEEDLPPFPEAEVSSLTLDNKPGARIHYTYYPASISQSTHPNPFSQTLIVFLNGLMTTRTSWDPTIRSFLEKRIVGRLPYPAIVSYDRYGQGDSDHDPDDKEPPPSHGHDVVSAVKALKQFTLQIWRDHLDHAKPTHYPCLIFVGNSIGCAIARIFTQCYPGTVSGLLFLDSIMANSDQSSLWPDPDAPDFNKHTLPDGVSEDEVRETRRKYEAMFGPEVPNMEGLSRRNLAKLLPASDAPRLEGYLGRGPYLTVVGHDWETFAEQSFRGSLKIPKILTMTYANPAWRRYNEGLVRITDEGRAIGPITAVRCGHFIPQDDPRFVSDEMVSLLDRVVNRVEQVSERD